METSQTAASIILAIRSDNLTTRDLVLISSALSALGNNNTSVLGQYGEELVAEVFHGKVAAFDQRGYDVVVAETGECLQVKAYTYAPRRRPGNIRSFAYDVITLAIDPETARVVEARRYKANDLHEEFTRKWQSKYRHINATFAAWGGRPEDRYDRGWTIGVGVPFTDVTEMFGEF